MERTNNTQRLTFGAMMVAIYGMFLLFNRQSGGFFEEMLLYLYPLPMIAYAVRFGGKSSIPVMISMGLISFLCGTFANIFYAVSQAAIGMAYGTWLHHRKDPVKGMFLLMGLSGLSNILTTIVFATLFGYNLELEIAEMQRIMAEAFAKAGMAEQGGLFTFEYLKRIFMISMLFFGAIQGFLIHMLSLLVLRKLGYDVPRPQPLSAYRPPQWTGMVALVLFFGYYVSMLRPFENEIVMNLVQCAGLCGYIFLIVFGLICVFSLIRRYLTRSGPIAAVLTFLSLFMLAFPVIILGYCYVSTNLRETLLPDTQQRP